VWADAHAWAARRSHGLCASGIEQGATAASVAQQQAGRERQRACRLPSVPPGVTSTIAGVVHSIKKAFCRQRTKERYRCTSPKFWSMFTRARRTIGGSLPASASQRGANSLHCSEPSW